MYKINVEWIVIIVTKKELESLRAELSEMDNWCITPIL